LNVKSLGSSTLQAQHGFFIPAITKSKRISRNNAEFRYNAEQIEKMADGFEEVERKLWDLIRSLRAWRSEEADI
jgi:hypothetical protein